MKRLFIFKELKFFLFVLFSLFFINSHAQNNNNKLTSTKKFFVREGTIIHQDARPKIDIEIDWFESKNGVADSINQKIFKKITSFVSSEQNKIENYQKLIDFYIEDIYREAFEGEDRYAASNIEVSTYVSYQTSDLLNISLNYEGYIGGAAHGFRGIYSLFFDLKTGEEIFLNDLFIDSEEFKKVAESFFRKEYEIPDHENINSVGFWFENDTFELPKNILITQDKIILFYNTYEIACYADGAKIVEIPKEKVKNLIRL